MGDDRYIHRDDLCIDGEISVLREFHLLDLQFRTGTQPVHQQVQDTFMLNHNAQNQHLIKYTTTNCIRKLPPKIFALSWEA